MRWVDGSEIKIEDFTGEALCEKLASDIHGVCEQYLDCADFIQTAAFLIEFDTELAMQGIFSFLENSIGHYAPHIVRSFRVIGDDRDADVLEEICRLAMPDIMRGEFLNKANGAYQITSFAGNHKIREETEEKITELAAGLYLYNDFDIWPLLFRYLDEQIKKQ